MSRLGRSSAAAADAGQVRAFNYPAPALAAVELPVGAFQAFLREPPNDMPAFSSAVLSDPCSRASGYLAFRLSPAKGKGVDMKRSEQGWEIYERMIARMAADQSATDLCVTPNARIMGKISGRSRQIDVLIDARHNTDNSRRVVVDAKNRKRKIDVRDVEALLGLMNDVGATHGYLISPSGHTKAAEKRAQKAMSIRIIPLDRLENFDPSTWPKCKGSRCNRGRVFWDGYPELSLTLRPKENFDEGKELLVRFVHYVGKCDRCGLFHVWCTTCDEIVPVPAGGDDDIGHQCRCKFPWFWLVSVEQDEEGNKSAELHAVLGTDKVITVDRRAR